MRAPFSNRDRMIHLRLRRQVAGASRRSSSPRSSVTPSPGDSGTRTNPFTGSIRSATTSLFQVSVALIKWKFAEGKADIMWAVMARVMLPPTFCSMKGLLSAAKRPARRTASPITWCPSHVRIRGFHQDFVGCTHGKVMQHNGQPRSLA